MTPPARNTADSVAVLVCAECDSAFDVAAHGATTKTGISICLACSTAYYTGCAECCSLIPLDEALTRGDLRLCAECYAKPPDVAGAGSLDQSDIELLIAEYTVLHAEEKRVGSRLEEIKDQLKDIAATQPRVSGAVTLRAGDQAVKCSFRTTLKCDAEAVERLEQTLNKNEFGDLFERKVTYSPHKERVQDFLSSTDGAHEDAREMLRAAVRETENATLTVVPVRKQ